MATRVTLPAGRFAPMQEARHGQPSVIADVRKKYTPVEAFLKNINAWCWRYKENTRNYPGFHFTARRDGIEAIAKCIEIMRSEQLPASRLIRLKPLATEDEEVISGGQAFECFLNLRITIEKNAPDLRFFSIYSKDEVIRFDFDCAQLQSFIDGLNDVANGTGDYSISPPDSSKKKELGQRDRLSQQLWFWPCFGHLYPVR